MIKIFFVSLLFLFPIGFVGLMHISAWTSKDCSQFVIDSYEVRSNIDIPAVDNFNCYYDNQQNLRLSVCKLQTNIDQYLKRYNFKATTLKLETILRGSHLLGAVEMPASSPLYLVEGTNAANYWKYVIEQKTGRMWIEMKFN